MSIEGPLTHVKLPYQIASVDIRLQCCTSASDDAKRKVDLPATASNTFQMHMGLQPACRLYSGQTGQGDFESEGGI